MINSIQNSKIETLLQEIGKALDISKSQYELVESRYKAVANHLSKEDSLLKDFKPDIMPQGSFLLGTMVKPIMEDDELDVDLVCRLNGKKYAWAQYHLKQEVGNQIKENENYNRMLDEEGKRCWTLLYADSTKFHMDILPAIIGNDHFEFLEKSYNDLKDDGIEKLSIRITDRTLSNYYNDTNILNWLKSNPFGYAGWFNDRKKTRIQIRQVLNEQIKPIPNYQDNKAPLQRSVQILKRHRDIMFGGDEDKPISIIITTLVAKAYQGEENLINALTNIIENMKFYIDYVFSPEHNKEIAWISNPVNNQENFADKWPDYPIKEQNFHAWLEKVQGDFEVLKSGDYTMIYRILKNIIGSTAVNEGFQNSGFDNYISESYYPAIFDRSLLNVSHREQPYWPLRLIYNVDIYGYYKKDKKQINITPSTTVPKSSEIFFTATTNTTRPFEVYWQVVNTGNEAELDGGLRGKIFGSKTLGVGGLRQKEHSLYKGIHWIQCFIVKNNVCVARSSEFFVNID